MKELLVLVFMGILCVGGSFFAAVILGEMWDFVSDPPFTNEQIIKEVEICQKAGLNYKIYASSGGYVHNVTCSN